MRFGLTVLLGLTFTLTSCGEVKTNDPIRAFTLWAGEPPSKDLKVLHGKYWQSGHFTKEYIMYLELVAPSTWLKEFIKQNKLLRADSISFSGEDAPTWFAPTEQFAIWKQSSKYDQGSAYYIDSTNHIMFIYEIQL